MYLKEIILEGFKSYMTRTVVKDFDPSFNAITGLNGSGKSNVLDSICFVLGISNLSQVRAENLQALVYKGGQAGVNKATVTLVFNNTDKLSAPVGYEAPDEITVTRQIVIGGRNKYLVNGVNAQPSAVHTLFHSVGLNVNNPHFLIMQGRITKVINMKPPEVLSMIEEAAGTKMYEDKKEAALRTIEKKERKVEEINSLLEEKINPSLAKLERERKHYLEWNVNNNDIEELKRYILAHKYFSATSFLNRSGEGSALHERMIALKDSLESLAQEHKSGKESLTILSKEHAKKNNNGKLEERVSEVEELSKKLVQLKTSWTNKKESLETEEKSLVSLEKALSEQTTKARQLRVKLKTTEDELGPAEENVKKATEDLEMAETALLTGASTQGSQGPGSGTGSLVDQLESARRAVSEAQTEIESLNQERRHLTSEYQTKATALAQDRANVRALEAKKKDAMKAVADAKVAVHQLDFDPKQAEAANARLHEERQRLAMLKERVDQLSARLESCEFRYSDPHPHFDRSKVHGLVAKLIRVKDPRMTTAIEVAAGGKLYQVVVDSDSTANELLKRGRLVRRVTILPLNKIRQEVLDRSKVENAKRIERSTELALHLVGYDDEISSAIKHVFGRTLVCPDMDAAKKVTFDNRVRARTVTLEGDVYDPSGTASGGSSTRQGASVLNLLSQLHDAESELNGVRAQVDRLAADVAIFNDKGRHFRQLQVTLEVKESEAKLLGDQLAETATGRLMNEVDSLGKRIKDEIPPALQTADEKRKEQAARVKDLETVMKNTDAAKKRAEQEAEAAMTKVRDGHTKATSAFQEVKNKLARLQVDIETVTEEIRRTEQEIETSKPAVDKLRVDVERTELKVVTTREKYEESQEELERERDILASSNSALAEAKHANEEIADKMESLNLEKAKLESKLKEADRGRVGAQKLVQDLENKHPWIQQEKEFFGVEGAAYEFSEEKVSQSSKKLENLEQRQENLSKRINKKAMHMFETAKEEYAGLIQKKKIIEEDKRKIEMVISGLDEKKMDAVEKTWLRVNEDFGNIFSDLLPGADAKLEPPEDQTVQSGLEIRVGFGDVWKDSLSELSGGQRSLIALSLILAMLRFKPAPMYILDEVDAALDLNHTQNIGRMLRRHFSGSQFIVVSLKPGMFSNANVIFRTKFVDGVSTIKRSENNAARQSKGFDNGDDNALSASLVTETAKENGFDANVGASNLRKRKALS